MADDYKTRAAQRAQASKSAPTQKMVAYIEGLLITCGYSRIQRNAKLTEECGREIRFIDEMTFNEAHRMIGLLEEQRDRARYSSARSEDDFDV